MQSKVLTSQKTQTLVRWKYVRYVIRPSLLIMTSLTVTDGQFQLHGVPSTEVIRIPPPPVPAFQNQE